MSPPQKQHDLRSVVEGGMVAMLERPPDVGDSPWNYAAT